MMVAITRAVSPAMNDCELEYLPRTEIDIRKAAEQHRRYQACLAELGAAVISLAAEPRAANVLTIGGTVLVPVCYPGTARILERLGWKTRPLDISELMKAEAGLTCSSILLENPGKPGDRRNVFRFYWRTPAFLKSPAFT